MTADEQSQVDKIEKDRRKREREMLALLLLFFGDAINHAAYAVRLGHDPIAASNSVLNGNPALELMGLANPLSRLLATTYTDGIARAFRMVDVPPPDPSQGMAIAIEIYRPTAQRMVDGMSQGMAEKIAQAIADSRTAGLGARKASTFLKNELKGGGYGYGKKADGTDASPYLLASVTELSVVNAHQAGLRTGYKDPRIDEKLLGFIHRSVLDGGTTEICYERDGFCRPKDDRYWEWNWPALHWGCRSCILPVMNPRKWSEGYPENPPAPGFGRAPFMFGNFRPAA